MKQILIIISIIIFVCCTSTTKDDDNSLIRNFINDIKNEKVTIEQIISNHFSGEYKTSDKKDVIELTNKLLAEVRENINTNTYEISLYAEANKKHKIKKIKDSVDFIYVLTLNENEEQFYYILTENSKINSILPMIKGEMVIGWVTP